MLILIYLNYFLSVISGLESLTSAIIRNNKLYAILQDTYLGQVKLNVYEINGGKTIDSIDNTKTIELFKNLKGFKLEFIDASGSLQGSHNKLWMRAELDQRITKQVNISYMNWAGYVNLDNMSLKTDPSIFEFPTHENFPLIKFTTNKIANEFGSALYVTGENLYSKKDDKISIGNSFFKYNLTTKEWVDMAYSVNGKLRPMIGHKAVNIDNRYLVILGGYIERSMDSSERLNGSRSIFEYYSLYNLTVFDTFTNSLNSVNIEPNVFDTKVSKLQFNSFLATVYDNKIVVLGGSVSENNTEHMTNNIHFGILDYNSRAWSWEQILGNGTPNFYYNTFGSDLLVYNNQVITLPAYPQVSPIQIYDMISHKINSTLWLSDASNAKYSGKAMPTYKIVLIAVSCTMLLLAFIYLLYRKYKNKTKAKIGKTKRNGPIREVWSSPDIDNTLNIIMLDKRRDITIRKNNSNELDSSIQDSNTVNSHNSNIIEFSK